MPPRRRIRKIVAASSPVACTAFTETTSTPAQSVDGLEQQQPHRQCHRPCSRHRDAPRFAGHTTSVLLCTQRLPLSTHLVPSFERLATLFRGRGVHKAEVSSCECGSFDMGCRPPPVLGFTTFKVLCYQNELCDWCTSLQTHFPKGSQEKRRGSEDRRNGRSRGKRREK